MGNSWADQMVVSDNFGWHIYVVSEAGDTFSKIGTAARPAYRLQGLQNGNPRRLTLMGIWHVKSRDDALRVERFALEQFGKSRMKNRDWISAVASDAVSMVELGIKKLGIVAKRLER